MTIAELTHVRDSGTKPGYRVEGNRLAAMVLVRCRIRERGAQSPVAADGAESADTGIGRGSLRLKITQVNPQTTLTAEDRP